MVYISDPGRTILMYLFQIAIDTKINIVFVFDYSLVTYRKIHYDGYL